ncbi:MAG TPA: hypothetical protein VKA31_06145 [Mariprofundaceae bacterium]|nr:hypothetical protein [Mariprofundaceae bacterium]
MSKTGTRFLINLMFSEHGKRNGKFCLDNVIGRAAFAHEHIIRDGKHRMG